MAPIDRLDRLWQLRAPATPEIPSDSVDLPYSLPLAELDTEGVSLKVDAAGIPESSSISDDLGSIDTKVLSIGDDLKAVVTIEVKKSVVYYRRLGDSWLPLA